MEPGIFPYVTYGGLGNQMFILAAAFVASEVNECPLYVGFLKNIGNPHNSEKEYLETIFKYFGIHIPMDNNVLKNKLLNEGYTNIYFGGFDKWNPCSIGTRKVLNSYFQYYPALAPFENEIREKFLLGLEDYRVKLLVRFEDLSSCGFVHIRRGDYLKNPTHHFVQPIEYYKDAETRVFASSSSTKKIFVISNDMEWVRSQPFFSENPLYTFFDSDDEIETLALMSLCTACAISANSSFSWWGAFLGAYALRNPVIVPQKWINEPIECLFPAEWLVI